MKYYCQKLCQFIIMFLLNCLFKYLTYSVTLNMNAWITLLFLEFFFNFCVSKTIFWLKLYLSCEAELKYYSIKVKLQSSVAAHTRRFHDFMRTFKHKPRNFFTSKVNPPPHLPSPTSYKWNFNSTIGMSFALVNMTMALCLEVLTKGT